MRKLVIIIVTVLVIAGLTGCGNAAREGRTQAAAARATLDEDGYGYLLASNTTGEINDVGEGVCDIARESVTLADFTERMEAVNLALADTYTATELGWLTVALLSAYCPSTARTLLR